MLGALVDAGVPFSALQETASALNVDARLGLRKVIRGGITGTKVDVLTSDARSAALAGTPAHDGLSLLASWAATLDQDANWPGSRLAADGADLG